MQATDAYEAAREKVQRFLNAADRRARSSSCAARPRPSTSWPRPTAASTSDAGDEVLITGLEHHSNIVPWQLLCEEKGARLARRADRRRGRVWIWTAFEKLLSPQTRIVSVAHVSNALGTVNPVRRIVELAHARGVPVLVDGAQAAPHMPVDVRALDCDFYAFSGHKIYGPTGVGVLYGKAALLEAMPPYQGGGDMILSVTFEKTTYNELPYKFEAGTPNIAGGIALGAALDYLNGLGLTAIARPRARPARLRARRRSPRSPGCASSAPRARRPACSPSCSRASTPTTSARSSTARGSPIRTGHHCAQPVMDRFGVPATARASFGLYNTREEIDALVAGLHKVIEMFR